MSDEIKKTEERAEEKHASETLIDNEQSEEIQAASNERNDDNTAVILKEKRELSLPMSEAEAKKNMSRRSRRTFLVGGATAIAGIFGWRWMPEETKNSLLNRAFRFNEPASYFSAKTISRPSFQKIN